MGATRTSITTSLIAIVMAAASTVRADIISGLEVHYEFENSIQLGHNSAGTPGVGWG